MIDPVCKMDVDVSTDYKINYKGITYYFCSESCLQEFKKSPEKFLDSTQKKATKVDVKIVYCRPCKYMDRALDLARDILSYFEEANVTLIQGDRGIFDVYVDDKLIFSRYKEKRFPEHEEILKKVGKLINEKREN